MPRSVRSTSLIHQPPFPADNGTTQWLIDVLARQSLPRNRFTEAIWNKWIGFREQSHATHNIPRPEASDPKKRMLVISVAEYADGLKNLDGAQTDWKFWSMLGLTSGWSVEVLADTLQTGDPSRQPTRNNIQRFARALLNGNKEGDQFIVAYSGHCDIRGLILADGSQIFHQELRDWFVKPLTTGSILWTFFDCCQASNLFRLPYKFSPDEDRSVPYLSLTDETQSRDEEVRGTVISIGSAADKAGELGLDEGLRCGSLSFSAYLFLNSVRRGEGPLLAKYLPYLKRVIASKEGQEAQITTSARLPNPVLPMLRAFP